MLRPVRSPWTASCRRSLETARVCASVLQAWLRILPSMCRRFSYFRPMINYSCQRFCSHSVKAAALRLKSLGDSLGYEEGSAGHPSRKDLKRTGLGIESRVMSLGSVAALWLPGSQRLCKTAPMRGRPKGCSALAHHRCTWVCRGRGIDQLPACLNTDHHRLVAACRGQPGYRRNSALPAQRFQVFR